MRVLMVAIGEGVLDTDCSFFFRSLSSDYFYAVKSESNPEFGEIAAPLKLPSFFSS